MWLLKSCRCRHSILQKAWESSQPWFHAYGAVIITGLFACLLASVLLLDLRSVFYTDWNNHLWHIEYFGESIKQNLVIPDVINTQQLIGMPLTLFYANKFYALLGTISAILGSAITVRIMVFTLLLLQFFQVYHAAMEAGGTKNISLCISVVVTWAIYPLTNLYNRSALTEFFAAAFLTCSLASLLCVIINARGRVSRYDIVATGLFYIAAAVTHPLTALFGGLFLCILGATALLFCEIGRKLWLLAYFSITALFSFLVLSPWIYLLYKFGDKLPISSRETNATFFQGKSFRPDSLDNVWVRLSPFPLDLRSIQSGVQGVSTPYLDVQITLPLLILIAILIYIVLREKIYKFHVKTSESAIIWVSAAVFIFVFIVSVYPKVSGWMAGFFDILQFPYRLVSYINLATLVITIMLARLIREATINNKQLFTICLVCCVAISFSALTLKLVHASSISGKSTSGNVWISNIFYSGQPWAPLPFGSIIHLNELPKTVYGAEGYSVVDGFSLKASKDTVPITHINFNVKEGSRFGQVAPLLFSLPEPTLVITNVQPFPWNRMVIDGLPLAQSNITVAEGRLAVLLPHGRYRMETQFNSDDIYKTLNLLSWVLLLLWIVLYAVIAFDKIVRESKLIITKRLICE